jgi:DNA-binding transcriptional ArsR family regulator
MDPKTHARFRARARIIKAMGHEVRLFVVHELAHGPKCVCELADAVATGIAPLDLSTVSKHLAVLKAAGIVTDERRGAQIYYALRCTCVLDFFECVESVMRANARAELELAK